MFFDYLKTSVQNCLSVFTQSEVFPTLLVVLIIVLSSLLVIIFVLVYTAFITVFERKVLAALQKRKGPNVVGFLGLLQAVADGLKLFSKETLIPGRSNKLLFIISPIVVFFISVAG